jgi:CRP-like cAMP-binding protein
VAQGTHADSLLVLLSGRLRATFTHQGTELTLGIFSPGEAFASMESFLQGTPSEYAIESIDAAEVLLVPRALLEGLMKENPPLFMDILAHHRRWVALLSRRVMELLIASPKERYLRFETEHPELMAQLPLYMVASLIGITPESLSRIRRRLAESGSSTVDSSATD